jgi:hypothetical protein
MKPNCCGIILSLFIGTMLNPANLFGQATNSPAIKLPEVLVTGAGLLQEEQPVGPYQQPEWATERRFPRTRVYLQQTPWNTGFEQWVRYRDFRDGTKQTRFQEEVEIGLPYRFQVEASARFRLLN